MIAKSKPKGRIRRLVDVRRETLYGGEPTIGPAHKKLIDAVADKVAAEAADRVIAKARKKGLRRPPPK